MLDSPDRGNLIKAADLLRQTTTENKKLQKIAGDSEAVEKATRLLISNKIDEDVDMVSLD